jgi:tetratricopeptide (TPR) repeat protein
MAPEQAAGHTRSLTKAADIYSLGAILYELLTARPPFRAGTPLDTLRQVTDQEPKRPRALNHSTPSDLETICLKCLSKDPNQRYTSAEALAEDLERFLEDLPIRARRPSLLESARKWSRRHRAVAVAVILILGLALLAFTVRTLRVRRQYELALVEEMRARAEFDEAKRIARQARDEAIDQRAQAERNFEKARQAVDELLTRTADMEVDRVLAMKPARRLLLQDALQFYHQLIVEETGDDPVRRLEKANAYLRVGEIQHCLGNLQDAADATRLGITLLGKPPEDKQTGSRLRGQLARAYTVLGIVLVKQGKHQQASRAIEELDQVKPEDGKEYRRAAGILSSCVPLAEKDANLPPEQRKSLAQKYSRQAVEQLREAVRQGYKDFGELKAAADLAAVRSQADFGKLMTELEAMKKTKVP